MITVMIMTMLMASGWGSGRIKRGVADRGDAAERST